MSDFQEALESGRSEGDVSGRSVSERVLEAARDNRLFCVISYAHEERALALNHGDEEIVAFSRQDLVDDPDLLDVLMKPLSRFGAHFTLSEDEEEPMRILEKGSNA